MRARWNGFLSKGFAYVVAFFKVRQPTELADLAPAPERHPWEDAYPADIDWRAEIPIKPLYTVFDDAVARFPDNPCVDFLGKKYSYREMGHLVDCAAKGLQVMGVGKGVQVGLLLPNCPYYVICYYAALKAGGTVININPLYAEEEILRQLTDSETRIVITLDMRSLHSKLAAVMQRAALGKVIVCRMADALPFPQKSIFQLLKRKEIVRIPADGRHVAFRTLVANAGDFRPVTIDPGRDIALLQYTGGTTGTPKGAMLTHASLHANTMQTAMWFPKMEAGRERILGVLPLCHVFAMTVIMNAGISQGAELVLQPHFRLESVLKAIHKRRPTLLPGVPTLYAAIIACKHLEKYDLSSLKFCLSGGAPLPMRLKHDFEALTGCKLVEGYGLTECAPVVAVNPLFGNYKERSVGLPLPGTIVEITALDDPTRLLPPCTTGEICVRGPQVMLGYWRQPEETAKTMIGGRLHTGDVGYMDEQGYTFITDRAKDLILVGGYNVYPRMVEEAILQHAAVADVAVCGIPDDYRGETVKAFIVPKGGRRVTLGELRVFLKDKLAPFEIPRSIAYRDTLPRTLIGKVSRKELVAEELAKRRSRELEPRRVELGE
ncbi:MAG TPA: long-chain fatty acid--CoA ligase [Dongiaceae bacterium]|nr:long-chain fatty acid--CoA ligase [Dongiaceae bacterium]